MAMQMKSESGGDPTAVNRWDVNWQRGTPSVGLMQVIGPTYRTHRHPQFDTGPYLYGTSVDPLSNVLAATRYTLSRYGNLAAGWKGRGYDLGGMLRPRTFPWNFSGRPERVLSPRQTEAFEQLVRVLSTVRGSLPAFLGARQPAAVSSAVQGAGLDPAVIVRAIESAVQRAVSGLDGTRLRIEDDGHHGLARVVTRQQVKLRRR